MPLLNVRNRTRALAVGLALLCGLAPPAHANPDVWVRVGYVARFNDAGMTGLQIEWTFDPYFSSRAISQIDTDGNRRLSADEAKRLRTEFFDPLSEQMYFAHVVLGETNVEVTADYLGAEIEDEHLVTRFDVIPEGPLDYRAAPVSFSLHDEEIFFDFSLADENFLLVEGPFDPACRFQVKAGEGPLNGHRQSVVLVCSE